MGGDDGKVSIDFTGGNLMEYEDAYDLTKAESEEGGNTFRRRRQGSLERGRERQQRSIGGTPKGSKSESLSRRGMMQSRSPRRNDIREDFGVSADHSSFQRPQHRQPPQQRSSSKKRDCVGDTNVTTTTTTTSEEEWPLDDEVF